MFTTAVDHQRSMLIHVLQGERERAGDNWVWANSRWSSSRAPRSRVSACSSKSMPMEFFMCSRGIRRPATRKVVEMKSAVDVDDTAVTKMVEESVEHAFEDLATRRWVEAKLKAR